jgi:hypothetical protein
VATVEACCKRNNRAGMQARAAVFMGWMGAAKCLGKT